MAPRKKAFPVKGKKRSDRTYDYLPLPAPPPRPSRSAPREDFRLTAYKPMQRPITAPIKPHEIEEINRFRNFRDQIRESPIYTVRGRPKVHKPDAAFDKRANDVPFMPMDYGRTYTSRYYRPKRTLPDLTTRPYALQFIPEELHYLLGVNKNKTNGETGETTKKLDIARDDWQSRLDRMAEEEEPPEDYDENENEDDENKSNKDNEDDPDAVEDLEEDESENDDYNAERYFDGGEDDDGDDGGGGGGNDDYGGGGDDYD